MNILFLDSPAFAKQDMLDAFKQCNISCNLFFHYAYEERTNPSFDAAFDQAVEQRKYEFVFSFNYYPIISNCCQRHQLKYISYVYDNPHIALFSYTIINSCNYVFLFDKSSYLTFVNAGITTVHYLPLAANVKRLSSMKCPDKLLPTVTSELSFVGSLYTEKHNLFDRLENLPKFTNGYINAIMNAQQKVYGYNFLEELLTPRVIADLQKSCPYEPLPDGTETPAYVYANYFLCRKITSQERITLLKIASERFRLKLFTHNPPQELPNAQFIGPVNHYDTMPLIFQNSCINLNITLKSIQTGIPLRCMDIMGSGGFLLTNYQQDLLDFFVPNEDFVYYENEKDFMHKIAYYLSHEKERIQIIHNCIGKMQSGHTFTHRVQTILNIV